MKISNCLLLTALLCLPAGAFTLDFAGNVGDTIPPTLTINVSGYGDVQFDSTDSLEIGNTYQNDDGSAASSLDMVNGDTVTVTFLGSEPLNVDFDFVGVSAGETFVTSQTGPTSYLVELQSTGNGAGIEAVSFTVVPEPSAALLGLIGAFTLVLRRRR